MKQRLKDFDWISVGFAGIWLVFLAYPLSRVLTNPTYSPVLKLLGASLILLFCFIYLLSYGANSLLPATNQLLRTLGWTLLLLLPALGLTFLFGPWLLYVSSYLVAVWAFQMPPRVGLPVGALIAFISAFCIFLWFPHTYSAGVLGTLLGSGFVLMMAYLVAQSEKRSAHRQELLHAKLSEDIARDVHDILGHSLTIIKIKAELAVALAQTQPERAHHEMHQVAQLSSTALAEARAAVTRIKSPSLAGELEAARRALETAQVKAHLPTAKIAQTVGTNETLFSWVLREAITNVVRHSNASDCWVSLSPKHIEISDNGPHTQIQAGNGLTGLAQRVEEAGGTLRITTDGRTRVLVSMMDFSPTTANHQPTTANHQP
ncbi:sensor histidine kinase [Rothia nasisuis]|uniref:sensor histidine kinase n=2 Tax=Rothia nasisuis TaxID=2109647 RepID=UPI001F02C331|nr:histidine kinase [Rothia nasisuis]